MGTTSQSPTSATQRRYEGLYTGRAYAVGRLWLNVPHFGFWFGSGGASLGQGSRKYAKAKRRVIVKLCCAVSRSFITGARRK